MKLSESEIRRTVNAKHVCERLGIPRQTLMRWVARGEFPAPYRIGRRILRWDAEAVNEWLGTQVLDINSEETE